MAAASDIGRELHARLAEGDIAWIRHQFHVGELNELRPRLSLGDWNDVPRRIEAGDLTWLRARFADAVVGAAGDVGATVSVGASTAPSQLPPPAPEHAAAPTASTVVDAPVVATAEPAPIPATTTVRAPTMRAPTATTATMAATNTATTATATDDAAPGATTIEATPRSSDDDRRIGGSWKWLTPLLVLVALLGMGIARCERKSSTAKRAATSSAAGVVTTAEPALGATSAASTAAVATTASEPTVATTIAPSTTTPPPATTVSATDAPAVTTAATVVTTTAAPPTADIVDTAARGPGFVTLVRALQAAGLDATLHGSGPFTVFAPTDAAFAQLPQATFDALLRDPVKLKQILQNHVVAGSVTSEQLQAGTIRTVGNGQLTVAAGSSLTINGAKVVTADIATTNGVIHAIDTVLVPAGLNLPAPSVAPTVPAPDIVQATIDAGSFVVFNRALVAAGLTDTLKGRGPYTVLAPTDDAFARLAPGAVDKLLADKTTLAKVLLYHVLPGKRSSASLVSGVKTVEGKSLLVNRLAGTITIDADAKIVTPDVAATNGVIHGIDRVVFPSDVDATPYEVPPSTADAVVYFDTDSFVLRADAKAVIADTAPRIRPGSTVILSGVADRRGNADANQTLSAQRAQAVANALTAAGATATFDVRAKGADPSDDLQSARRVEIDLP